MDELGLMDLDFLGPQFTWNMGVSSDNFVGARLDRGICNMEWRMSFPDASVLHLPRAHSDHYPILLNTSRENESHGRFKRFYFQSAWFLHDTFSQWFAENWSKEPVSIVEKTKAFTERVQDWSHTIFGDLNKKKKRLWARIAGIQKSLMGLRTNGLLKLERKLQLELDEILKQEEVMWFQKSRCEWIDSGDRNTKYFHRTATIKCEKKVFTSLMDDRGGWVSDPLVIRNQVVEFYERLYHDEGRELGFMLDNNFLVLSEVEVQKLQNPVCLAEVYGALFDMELCKSPGIDGFSAHFYQKGWSLLKEDLFSYV